MSNEKQRQLRHWVITEWPTDEMNMDDAHLLDFNERMNMAVDGGHVRFAGWQVEAGESEKPHVQCYVEFNRPRRLSEVKNVLQSPTAHCEGRRGSRTQACDYCTKDEGRISGPFRVGEWREESLAAGKSKADRCIDLILEGLDPHQVAREDPAAFFTHSRKVWDDP